MVPTSDFARFLVAIFDEHLGDFPTKASRCGNQPLAVFRQEFFINTGFSCADALSIRYRHEFDQVVIPLSCAC